MGVNHFLKIFNPGKRRGNTSQDISCRTTSKDTYLDGSCLYLVLVRSCTCNERASVRGKKGENNKQINGFRFQKHKKPARIKLQWRTTWQLREKHPLFPSQNHLPLSPDRLFVRKITFTLHQILQMEKVALRRKNAIFHSFCEWGYLLQGKWFREGQSLAEEMAANSEEKIWCERKKCFCEGKSRFGEGGTWFWRKKSI